MVCGEFRLQLLVDITEAARRSHRVAAGPYVNFPMLDEVVLLEAQILLEDLGWVLELHDQWSWSVRLACLVKTFRIGQSLQPPYLQWSRALGGLKRVLECVGRFTSATGLKGSDTSKSARACRESFSRSCGSGC